MNEKRCEFCAFGTNLKLSEGKTYCELWELEFASNDRCSSFAREEKENEQTDRC